MKNIFIIFLFAITFSQCRPEINGTVTDSSIFDYNFNGFITEKTDTVKSATWVSYELYFKPISTSLLKEVHQTIVLKPTIDKDLKAFYQVYDLNNQPISVEQRTGDVISISATQLIEHKVFLKIKVLPPNELGKSTLTIHSTWNDVSKSIVKSVFIMP